MTQSGLSPELLSLVHHVELQKSGWWERAIDRLILSAVWGGQTPATSSQIHDRLQSQVSGLRIDSAKFESRIEGLLKQGLLIQLSDDRICISEAKKQAITKDIESTAALEDHVRKSFLDCLKQQQPLLASDKTWVAFKQYCLLPLFRNNGARVYEMLLGSNSVGAIDAEPTDFLEMSDPRDRVELSSAINRFFGLKDPLINSYMLRHLNAHFCIEASSLSAATIATLNNIAETAPDFDIFVDTNFLFSILEMHANPSNHAAITLLELISQLGPKTPVRLYVMPSTLDEAKRVLAAHQQQLSGAHYTVNTADAALALGVSGINQRFLELVREKPGGMRPEEYFEPYIKNLVDIIQRKGVKVYSEPIDSLLKDQSVLDDIASQYQFEKSKGPNRAKTYEQLRHDITLWHFLRRKRPAYSESPLRAKCWVVTVDYRFILFDQFKQRRSAEVPICIHPTTLIQMLQLWIPRNPKFEDAVLSNLVFPFMSDGFDSEAEKVTVKIIRTIGRFENASDLSPDMVKKILLDQALRQRMLETGDNRSAQEDLIRDELLQESIRARDAEHKSKARIAELEKQLDRQNQEMSTIQEKGQHQRDEEKRRAQELEKEIEKERNRRAELARQIREWERKAPPPVDPKAVAKARMRFFLFVLLAFIVVIVVLSPAVMIVCSEQFRWPRERVYAATAMFLILLLTYSVGSIGGRIQAIADWIRFRQYLKWRKFVILAAMTGIIGNLFWDIIRSLIT